MTNKKTKYIITRDCFCGKKGEHLLVDWNAYDASTWENTDTNKIGAPFAEMDFVKEEI